MCVSVVEDILETEWNALVITINKYEVHFKMEQLEDDNSQQNNSSWNKYETYNLSYWLGLEKKQQ